MIRQNCGVFECMVRSNDVMELRKFFINAYIAFLNNPGIVGLPREFVNEEKNDTDIKNLVTTMNTDTFNFENGDAAALCYMPVQNDLLEARMIGVILGKNGDGYYYCMLNKDKNAVSPVKCNKAVTMEGIQQVGEVKGRGFELMNDFLSCIKNDFYSTKQTIFMKDLG